MLEGRDFDQSRVSCGGRRMGRYPLWGSNDAGQKLEDEDENEENLSLGRQQNLVLAEPADAGGIAADLEPIVVLVDDAEFRTVVDGESSLGIFKGAFADRD